MIVIGAVFLVLAALGVIAAVVMGRDVQVSLDGFGVNVTTDVLWVFCAGALAMLLLLIALSAFRRAGRRRRAQRRELKQLRAEEALAAENRAQPRPEVRAEHRADPVDVRDTTDTTDMTDTTHTTDATVGRTSAEGARVPTDDPGPERRYIPGDEPSA